MVRRSGEHLLGPPLEVAAVNPWCFISLQRWCLQRAESAEVSERSLGWRGCPWLHIRLHLRHLNLALQFYPSCQPPPQQGEVVQRFIVTPTHRARSDAA